MPAAEPSQPEKPEMRRSPHSKNSVGAIPNCRREQIEKRVALYGFLVVLAVCCKCNAEPRKITEAEKNFCAEAYRKYCSEYGLESAALRNCMDRNGRALQHDCIEALIDAGEVSRGEVERRKKSGK